MVREFQAVIGRETKDQCLETLGKLPDYVLACVGGGSNAIGMFAAFLDCPSVRLVGLEAGGTGGDRHAATLTHGSPGVLHGTMSYLLQDGLGGIAEAHSISAGLDYPGVGPEHSHLKATGRATYLAVRDDQALEGFRLLARREGILCALETAHVIGYLEALMPETSSEQSVVINLSGRGDKDMPILQQTWGDLLQV
jgi:tryptophan synthase beta chain